MNLVRLLQGTTISIMLVSSALLAQTYTVSGTLSDADTGKPIVNQGEYVCLRNTDYKDFGCLNPTSGKFQFVELPDGEYILQAMADGYITGIYKGFAEDACGGSGKGTPIKVGPDATGIEFELPRGMYLEGKIISADGSPTNLAYIDITAIDHDEYCGWERYNLGEGGLLESPKGWNALLAGTYALMAVPTGPEAPAYQLATGQRGESIKNIVFYLGDKSNPRAPAIPPNAELISMSEPDPDHLVRITGQPGAAKPGSAVILYNLDVGSIDVIVSDHAGAFSGDLFAPWGSLVMVKQDPNLIILASRENGDDLSLNLKPLPGTMLYRKEFQAPNFFQQTGPTHPLPAWQVSGTVSSLQASAGQKIGVNGTLKLLSHIPGANPSIIFPSIDLTRITNADGQQIIPNGRFSSTRMTPTDLPIEHACCPTDRVEAFDLPMEEVSHGSWEGIIDTEFTIPSNAQPGYYQPWFNPGRIQLYETEPQNPVLFGPSSAYQIPLPLIRVGNPNPPKVFLHLLSDLFHNGSRGIRATEDREFYGVSMNMGTNSDVFVIPMTDSLSGQPITYNLEPYIPQALFSERSQPGRRMPLFEFPSGRLTIKVSEPSGVKTSLGPTRFKQIAIRSPAKGTGRLTSEGGQHATNILQLRTMDPQFDVQFDEYGKHTVEVEMSIDDQWGITWTGSGTFEIWVAQPLVLDTTVFPGMSFQRGDVLNTGVTVSPAGPATVEFKYMIAPESARDKRHTSASRGQANQFGQYTGSAIELDEAGEYRADVTASYVDEEGVLWMGSRTWGGVVARPSPPIVAHGKRVLDKSPAIGPQWFTREGLGEPEGDSHVPFPYSSGDIQWVHSDDAAIPMTSFQALSDDFKDIFLDRLTMAGNGPGSLEEKVAVGAIPLISGGIGGVEPHMNPELTDLWAYSYMSSQRPLVRVRELISESTISPYWRFNEQYNRQVGVGLDGDRINEIKFQYTGVVIKGDALERPEYAIHGSLFVLVQPPGAQSDGTRTFPPFQGNGGGPSGGPIITHKGEDIDLLINLRAARPGSIFELGDTFSLSGAFAPTLPARLQYTITRPDGSVLDFKTSDQRVANPVGYYYRPDDDFELDQPGVWTVDLTATFDGRTSAGKVTAPFPTGDVLGSEDGRYYFYVVDADQDPVPIDLPRYSLFEPTYDQNYRNENKFELNIKALLPEGMSMTDAHVTTIMPGTILESRELENSLVYNLNVSDLGAEVLNLDWENGLADLLTTSIYVKAKDGQGNTHHLGRIINFHGSEIMALNVPEPDKTSIEINAGHAGAWYNPATPGQGQLIDIEPASKFLFLSWFTYTDADAAHPDEQHWFTAQGNYSGETAQLAVYETLGGQFDNAKATSTTAVGILELSFSDCANGQANYTIDSWGLAGSFPLTRAVPGTENLCLDRSGNADTELTINDGRDGAWYDIETPGQGFLVDILTSDTGDDFIFLAWFTYGEDTASEQRWLTAQGPLVGTTAEIPVYETTDGSLDDPKATTTRVVGSIILEFTGCNSGLVTYSLTDEALAGSIEIQRAIPGTETLCEELSGAQ